MSKENLKNKGITLIALIITIIVMLILTGVTLSITLGDNGLVNKAKEATTQTQVAMDRELLLSAVVGAIGNDGKVNLSSINLPEGFTGSNGTYTSSKGHSFTVSANGEVEYTGSTDSDDETETVDLNGKYYYTPDDAATYYEIRNNSTMVVIDGEEEYEMGKIEINQDNKTVIVTQEYEDENTNEVSTDTFTFTFTYAFVLEDDKIVNIIIMVPGGAILFQNQNGFEYNLDGVYLREDGSESFTFNSENGTALQEYYGTDSFGNYTSSNNYTYFGVNGIYCLAGNSSIEISNQYNTISIDGVVYNKQETE